MSVYGALLARSKGGEDSKGASYEDASGSGGASSSKVKQGFVPLALKYRPPKVERPPISQDLPVSPLTEAPMLSEDDSVIPEASQQTSQVYNHFELLEDEYDPHHPNEYENAKSEIIGEIDGARSKKQLERQMDEERERRVEEKKRQTQEMESLRHAAPAAGGRGRGIGMIVPAWMHNPEAAEKPQPSENQF